jgi:hypothetical protein
MTQDAHGNQQPSSEGNLGEGSTTTRVSGNSSGLVSPTKLYENLSRHEIKSAVIGMVLGDANLQMRVKNARIQMAHSPRQEEYVAVKASIIRQVPGISCKFTNVLHQNRKLNKVYPQVRLWSTSHPFFTDMRERLYAPVKRLTDGILSSLTNLGLAIWYMDDGHLSLKHNVVRSPADKLKVTQERSIAARSIYLNTHGFSEGENRLICDWLKSKYCIEARVKNSKGFYVFMNTENARKFVDVVRPYVLAVPCMHYKIDFKYKNPTDELRRFNVTEEGHERAASQISI